MVAKTQCKVTTDHEEIRGWAAARGGKPVATIPKSASEAAICISFPDERDNSRHEISWREWFKKFEAGNLALLYQEHAANGDNSNFNKLVSRETVDKVEDAVGGKGRSASRKMSRHEVGANPTSRDEGRVAGSRKFGKKSAVEQKSRLAQRSKN